MSSYWPWWAGAIALGVIPVVYAFVVERPLGVSGAWDRVIHWRRERERDRQDAAWAGNTIALTAALAQATRAQFDTRPGTRQVPRTLIDPPVDDGPAERDSSPAWSSAVWEDSPDTGRAPALHRPHPGARLPTGPVPVAFQAVFLASVFAGGVLAALTSGRIGLRLDMGEGFSRIVTDRPAVMVIVLFLGGVLVGFGTRLAGGCSSGHGLSGCSRLQPASLLATALFFSTAVAVSYALELW